jgi:hypothetical protein
MLECVLPKSRVLLCASLRAKELSAKDIQKEMFSVYGGKCLSLKAFYNWVEKFSQGRSKVADDARPGAEVAETTVKRLLCCGFRRTEEAMRQVYQCWWRICREIIFPPASSITCFTFYIHLWPIYWLPPYKQLEISWSHKWLSFSQERPRSMKLAPGLGMRVDTVYLGLASFWGSYF